MRRRATLVRLVVLCAAVAVLTAAGPVEPAVLGVNTTDDPGDGECTGDHCTLREAIAAAAPGDEIRFSWDLVGTTIVLDHDAGPLVIEKDLTIRCLFPSYYFEFDLVVSGDNWNRVFHVLAGDVTISGLAVSFGYDGSGAGAILNYGHLTLERCRVDHSGIGGIQSASDASLVILDSFIADNYGAPAITSIGEGTRILRTWIGDNSAGYSACAGLANIGHAEVRDCTFTGNHSLAGATAIFNSGTLLLADSAMFANNSVDGGPSIHNSGALTMTNVTVGRNYGGVSLIGPGASATVLNSTVTANETWHTNSYCCSGGISVVGGGSLELQNTIVAGNVYFGSLHLPDADCCGPVTSLGNNLVGVGTGCPTLGTDLTVDPDQVFDSVLEYSPGYHGGLTRTHALRPGSPAIDAADPVACPATDQRHFPRPFDGDGDQAAVCDIGAYEYAPHLLFFDGFESCSCSRWSRVLP